MYMEEELSMVIGTQLSTLAFTAMIFVLANGHFFRTPLQSLFSQALISEFLSIICANNQTIPYRYGMFQFSVIQKKKLKYRKRALYGI